MSKDIAVFLAISILSSPSFGAVTNYVNNGSSDPDTLSNTNYVGTGGNNAATISNISDLNVLSAKFTGGAGVDASSSENLTVVAGAGLKITNVDSVEITGQQVDGEKIQGGKGASISITSASIRDGIANGGHAVDFSGNSLSRELLIHNGYMVGGDGSSVSGLGLNSLSANGGSAIYANTGTVNAKAGLFVGGVGGVVVGDGASAGLRARGGNGIDINFTTADIRSLDGNISAIGGAGGTANGSSAILADATGGNAVNLRWNTGGFGSKTALVNGGIYTGGAGGSSSAITATANGGLGMLVQGGQSVLITNGTFTGGAGGVANGTNAQASGGAGASIFLANAFAGGSAEIKGGTFNGGAAGVENGGQGEEGYGLLLTASSSEISGVEVGGRGLLVNAAGLSTETRILGGVYSRAVFTSFIPPEFTAAAPMVNVFTIEDGAFGDIVVDGLAGSDGEILSGVAEDLMLQGSGENDIKLGSTFAFQDLYLGGTATNSLSISNGVASSGNVILQGGTTDINLWNDDNFVNTSVSNATINFYNQMFYLNDGYRVAVESQNARVNFNGGVTLNQGATLDVGEGMVDADTFSAADGANIYMALNGSTNGVIKGDSLTFGDANWFLSGSTIETNKIYILAEGSSSNSLTAPADINWVSSVSGPNWLYGITDVYAQSNQFIKADFGLQSLDRALGVDSASALGKAMADFSLLVSQDSEAWAIASSFSSEEEASRVLSQTYVQTAEMASTLIRQQELYADQIKERTRSFVSHKNYGTSYSLPQGPGGPENWQPEYWYDETKDRLTEALPKPQLKGEPADLQKPYMSSKTKADGNVYDSVKDTVHRIFPSKDVNVAKNMRSFEEKSKPYVADVDVPASYQVWGRVFSSWYDQKAVQNFAGYDAMVYGATIGADRRFDHLMVGLGGGFADTTLDGNAGNNGDALSGYGTVYAAFSKGSWYLDLNVNGAVSSVKTESSSSFNYTGDFDAYSAGLYIGSGYSVELFGKGIYGMVLTPEVSLLSTYYSQEAYDETSSTGGAPVKSWDEYDQGSYLSSVGVTLSQSHKIQSFKMEMEFKPEVRAHWLHEFNADMDAPSYVMAGGANRVGVALQPREEDLLKVGAGIRFNSWYSDALEFGLDLDGTFGEDYSAYIVSGKLLHRF